MACCSVFSTERRDLVPGVYSNGRMEGPPNPPYAVLGGGRLQLVSFSVLGRSNGVEGLTLETVMYASTARIIDRSRLLRKSQSEKRARRA